MTKQERRAEADWMAAFGDPARLAVLRLLAAGPRNVSAIAERLGLPMVNVSHHLGSLRASGLVASERSGRHITYRLVGARVTERGVEFEHPSGATVVLPLTGRVTTEAGG